MRNQHLSLRNERLGLEKLNNQGCLMKIIEYNGANDIVVEFQDEYKYKKCTRWEVFQNGEVKNDYFPQLYEVGIVGNKYSSKINNKTIKEYYTWHAMLSRCYNKKVKEKQPTYKDVTCCEEWLLYENFYEWLHSQENFDKWYNLERSALDKDIILKGNKVYSPENCCLVPYNINALFTKRQINRGDSPIGVMYHKRDKIYEVNCNNGIGEQIYLGRYKTQEEAFYVYKEYKENLIKQLAQEEYDKGNITKKCYEAMMNYIVEITD